jgi:hypothetical protein
VDRSAELVSEDEIVVNVGRAGEVALEVGANAATGRANGW